MDKPARAWAAPGARAAVVLGRSQRLLQVDPVLPVRRRASGGGAVLTGPWLLRAAVRLPRGHGLLAHGPAPLASWFGRVHLQWLQMQGLSRIQMHAGRGLEHWACFGGLSTGELSVDGRKLTGIAQVWQRSSVLVSAGTLLHPPPWALLCQALRRPGSEAAALARGTIALDECLARPVDGTGCARSLGAALALALERADGSGADASPRPLAPDQRTRARPA